MTKRYDPWRDFRRDYRLWLAESDDRIEDQERIVYGDDGPPARVSGELSRYVFGCSGNERDGYRAPKKTRSD
jgi:hypothetical protein